MKKTTSLQKLRLEVDGVDQKLIVLLNQRMRLARRIGRLKAINGQRIFDALRERSLMRRLTARNKGPLQERELSAIYRLILQTSRRHQKRVQG